MAQQGVREPDGEQDIFQSKPGYGPSHYPWAINDAKGIVYDYSADQFPVAQALCDTHTLAHGIHAPNGRPLMERTLRAFHKVLANLGQALGHTDDAIHAGAGGRLYGTA